MSKPDTNWTKTGKTKENFTRLSKQKTKPTASSAKKDTNWNSA